MEPEAASWPTFEAARDAVVALERQGHRLGTAWRVTEYPDGQFRVDLCPGGVMGSRWLSLKFLGEVADRGVP